MKKVLFSLLSAVLLFSAAPVLAHGGDDFREEVRVRADRDMDNGFTPFFLDRAMLNNLAFHGAVFDVLGNNGFDVDDEDRFELRKEVRFGDNEDEARFEVRVERD